MLVELVPLSIKGGLFHRRQFVWLRSTGEESRLKHPVPRETEGLCRIDRVPFCFLYLFIFSMPEPQFVEVHYFKQVRKPTLRQYLVRRAIKEAGSATREVKGVVLSPTTGNPMPKSASIVGDNVRGLTAEKLLELHPEWEEDYEREYGKPGKQRNGEPGN